MVANLRCNELKDEALDQIRMQASELNEQASRGKIADFQEKCKSILKQAISHYEEYAHQYDKTIYEKIRKELVGLVLS